LPGSGYDFEFEIAENKLIFFPNEKNVVENDNFQNLNNKVLFYNQLCNF